MVTLRILHAKNQPPRPKTVAYRPRTDTQTDRQTDRQTEKANTEDPFFQFFFLIFDFLLKERSKNGLLRLNQGGNILFVVDT